LLRIAADLRADLLVMGAYGRARLRELILGGATRDVLRAAELPVLFSC
jgi:nucleotide-binding universal stress UspA family protein